MHSTPGWLNYPCNDLVSKYGHTERYWTLRFQHTNLRRGHISTPNTHKQWNTTWAMWKHRTIRRAGGRAWHLKADSTELNGHKGTHQGTRNTWPKLQQKMDTWMFFKLRREKDHLLKSISRNAKHLKNCKDRYVVKTREGSYLETRLERKLEARTWRAVSQWMAWSQGMRKLRYVIPWLYLHARILFWWAWVSTEMEPYWKPRSKTCLSTNLQIYEALDASKSSRDGMGEMGFQWEAEENEWQVVENHLEQLQH